MAFPRPSLPQRRPPQPHLLRLHLLQQPLVPLPRPHPNPLRQHPLQQHLRQHPLRSHHDPVLRHSRRAPRIPEPPLPRRLPPAAR